MSWKYYTFLWFIQKNWIGNLLSIYYSKWHCLKWDNNKKNSKNEKSKVFYENCAEYKNSSGYKLYHSN